MTPAAGSTADKRTLSTTRLILIFLNLSTEPTFGLEPVPTRDPERAAKRALARADIARSGGPDPRDAAMIAQYRQQRDDPAERIRRLSRDFH